MAGKSNPEGYREEEAGKTALWQTSVEHCTPVVLLTEKCTLRDGQFLHRFVCEILYRKRKTYILSVLPGQKGASG